MPVKSEVNYFTNSMDLGSLPISHAWGHGAALQLPRDFPILQRSSSSASASHAPNRARFFLPLRKKEPERLHFFDAAQTLHLFLDMPSPDLAVNFYLSVNGLGDLSDPDMGMIINVNGRLIRPLKRDAQKIELPQDSLVEGRNEITLRLRQASTSDCSRHADSADFFGLDIDRSGVEVSLNQNARSLSWFKAALSAQIASGMGVPLRGFEMMSGDQQRALATKLSGTDSGTGNWLRFETRYGPHVRPISDLVRISVGLGIKSSAALEVAADGTVVLALVIGQDGSFSDALEKFFPSPMPVSDVPSLIAGKATSFQALAIQRTSVAGETSRYSISFRIADTWLLMADQKANLVFRFDSVLIPVNEIQILIKVNGISLDPLHFLMKKTSGEQAISFPARYLHPGVNTLTLEPTVPNEPSGTTCFNSGFAERLNFGYSTLTLPTSPLMRTPGMLPALIRLTQSSIVVPDWAEAMADRQIRVVTLALLAQMHPLAGQMPDKSVSLTIVSLQNVDLVPFGDEGLIPADLRRILNEHRRTLPEAAKVRYDLFHDWITTVVSRLDEIVLPGDPSFQAWSQGKTGDAVLIMPNRVDPGQLWLVLGPNADPARVAAAVARTRTSPNGPRGQIAILDEDETWLDWQPATTMPELLEPLSLWNIRVVAGNFASASPLHYIVTLFGFLLLFILFAGIFVMSTRRRDRT